MTRDNRRARTIDPPGRQVGQRGGPGPHGPSGRVLVDGRGPVAELIVAHLHGQGVRALHGAWAAEAALLAMSSDPLGIHEPAPPLWSGFLGDSGAGASTIDVIVLIDGLPVDPWRARPWVAAGVPQLPVEVARDLVVVGPLVDPGRSACLLCHEYTRHDQARLGRTGLSGHPARAPRGRDLSSILDVDVVRSRRAASADGPTSVVLLASALAAALVLDVLAGDLSMAGISTDVMTPVPELVHRHWPRHPRCGCAAVADRWRAPA